MSNTISKKLMILFTILGVNISITNTVMASGNKTPQQTLDEITSRPGEVKGVVIKQTPQKVTVLEQKYEKPAVKKTYTKPNK
jgi:hypothetical protein